MSWAMSHDLPGAGGDLALDVLGDCSSGSCGSARECGDGAIGAEAVAAVGYLHVWRTSALPFRRLAPNGRPGKGGPSKRAPPLPRYRPRDCRAQTPTPLRQLRGQVVPVAGRHAAGDDEDGTPSSTLGRKRPRRWHRCFSSVAAWMNEQVFTMMASALDASSVPEKPASRKPPRHGGRVHLVLRAPHRDEADGGAPRCRASYRSRLKS